MSPLSLSKHRIKNFYCISSHQYEKFSSHHELLVQYGGHLPCLCYLVGWIGWLNSGEPTLVIPQHLLNVEHFVRTAFLLVRVDKFKN